MTMLRDLLMTAWLAEASYVRLRNPSNQADVRLDLTDSELDGRFSSSQAERLLPPAGAADAASLGFTVLHQVDLSALGYQSGFSAMLFRDTINLKTVSESVIRRALFAARRTGRPGRGDVSDSPRSMRGPDGGESLEFRLNHRLESIRAESPLLLEVGTNLGEGDFVERVADEFAIGGLSTLRIGAQG